MDMANNNSELIESGGPWPFTTRRTFRVGERGLVTWHSRHHRKNLRLAAEQEVSKIGEILARSLYSPRDLNWWIGTIFALGSMFFLMGSVFSLAPSFAKKWSVDSDTTNLIFFLGSIPFTTAAYLQLYQSANSGEFSPTGGESGKRRILFGWRPTNIGWLSCACQFAGTILFNFNTFDAMLPGLDWLQQDFAIWVPDFAGSVLFLVSGYLAFIEVCHKHWAWMPENISWWVTFVNLLGCIAFMVSAVFAFVPPIAPGFDAAQVSVFFTLLGALGFLSGSLLILPETGMLSEP